MDVDCDLTLVHIFGVVVDHDPFRTAELAEESLRTHDFLRGVSSGDPDHIEKLLFDYAELHQVADPTLFVSRQTLGLLGLKVALVSQPLGV